MICKNTWPNGGGRRASKVCGMGKQTKKWYLGC